MGDATSHPADTERARSLWFARGAFIGAMASLAWGVHAIWLPAGFVAVTLVLFIIDERHLR